MLKQFYNYFTKFEKILWLSSVILIVTSFFLFDSSSPLTLFASIIGVTSLIFNAKGNPFGQLLMVFFAIIYGIISYDFRYYGEMITYVGMSLPIAVFSLVSWLRNPFKGKKSEVTVTRLRKGELPLMILFVAVVTLAFYFILGYFGTKSLLISTFSVTTSLGAAYLTFRRNPYFAFVYALNDIVLIVLWTIAAIQDISYVSVVVCFAVFLVNDLYTFTSWKRMEKRQQTV